MSLDHCIVPSAAGVLAPQLLLAQNDWFWSLGTTIDIPENQFQLCKYFAY
jgi:hypothetical protein